MILNSIVLILLIYVVYKMLKGEPIPYLSDIIDDEGFRVSAWDGRGTDLKKCLNSIEGIRPFYYHDALNICDQRDPFNKYL